jgi:hypothetical protein
VHKTLKFNGLRVQEFIDIPSPPAKMEMDAPDYYDWLDYQAVLCAEEH